MRRQPGKPKLPRGKMAPGTRVHSDGKKEKSRTWCREEVGDMEINYWDCEFSDYDERWDGAEEHRFYGCTHPNGDGTCCLENKFGGMTDDCKLLG